jgi:hypothetical protein
MRWEGRTVLDRTVINHTSNRLCANAHNARHAPEHTNCFCREHLGVEHCAAPSHAHALRAAGSHHNHIMIVFAYAHAEAAVLLAPCRRLYAELAWTLLAGQLCVCNTAEHLHAAMCVPCSTTELVCTAPICVQLAGEPAPHRPGQ